MSVSENGIQSAMQRLAAAQAEIERLTAELEREEKSHAETIGQRDRTETMADELARAIGGDAVGEHSNINCPWTNAMGIAREMNDEITRLKSERDAATVERDDAMALFHAADKKMRVLVALQPDAVRAEPVNDENLQLSERYQAIYEQASQRVALDEQQGLHLRMGGGVVEVCPVCDIAGCRHIRACASASRQRAAPKATEAMAALFRFDGRIEWRGHDDARLIFAVSPTGEWVRAEDHDILVTDLQTLLARVLVMDRGSAEEAAEALGGLPEAIRLVETHHAAHPRPGHPENSPSPDEVEF